LILTKQSTIADFVDATADQSRVVTHLHCMIASHWKGEEITHICRCILLPIPRLGKQFQQSLSGKIFRDQEHPLEVQVQSISYCRIYHKWSRSRCFSLPLSAAVVVQWSTLPWVMASPVDCCALPVLRRVLFSRSYPICERQTY